jgi:hypothetical protein
MKNLYKSLAKFQKEVKNIPKNSKGYGYDYAKLEDIIRIVTPTLNKNGLVLIQSIDTDIESRLPSVKTILAHMDTGESIESNTPISEVKLGSMNTYQSLGSGITYMRRYSIAGILGIAPDDDIDASKELVRETIETKKPELPLMTDSNYESIKKRCLAQWKKEKSWAEIRLMVRGEFTLVDEQINKLQTEITNAKR